MADRDIYIRIERYIKGELSQDEIDSLWIEFIRDPDMFNYFETYVNLIALSKRLKYQ